MKCDNCKSRQATIHVKEIREGKILSIHLCPQCAAPAEPTSDKSGGQHTPINKLLTEFVLQTSGVPQETPACPICGINWAEFRQSGLFGCEHDYAAFEKDLS